MLISIILTFQVALGPSAMGADSCTSGWYVTGYYTPHESDFSGKLIQIQAEGQSLQVKKDFIAEIKIEGWGKLESGLYLGWYDSMYHLSPDPLDAHDTALSETSLAADPNVLSQGTKVYIPTIPSPYDKIIFTISDVGPSIIGKHVDVYTGEGQTAYDDMFNITGYDNIVCVVKYLEIRGDQATSSVTNYQVIVSGQISLGHKANPNDILSPDGTTINGKILPVGLDNYYFTGDIVSITTNQHVSQ